MPIRSLNYTNRKRIERNSVSIRLVRLENQLFSFDAQLRLDDYDLPPDALIFVEAYRSAPAVYMRFSFGTVGVHTAPATFVLADFEGSESILFRVKVVDSRDAQGKLLAEADKILPITAEDDDATRIGLLPIRSEDLGEQVWKIDFNERMPILLINRNLDKLATAKSDAFMALAYPAILRQILSEILVVEKWTELDDEDDWRSLWLQFARGLPGVGDPPVDDIEDKELQTNWIEDAVSAFCVWLRVFSVRYQAAFRQEEEQ